MVGRDAGVQRADLLRFRRYSTTAIGVALCSASPCRQFPLHLRGDRFLRFWRRWHITLSSWLRDYLYIPLGGNRHGPARTYAALMGTMLLGGLWHGAAWTFVAWGGLHGLYLSVERWLKGRFAGVKLGRGSLIALGALTFVLINITWVFFRAKDFTVAATILRSMAGLAAKPIPMIAALPMLYAMVIVAALSAHSGPCATRPRNRDERTPAGWSAECYRSWPSPVVAERGKAVPSLFSSSRAERRRGAS